MVARRAPLPRRAHLRRRDGRHRQEEDRGRPGLRLRQERASTTWRCSRSWSASPNSACRCWPACRARSTIGELTGRDDPRDRVSGSVAAHLIAAQRGAHASCACTTWPPPSMRSRSGMRWRRMPMPQREVRRADDPLAGRRLTHCITGGVGGRLAGLLNKWQSSCGPRRDWLWIVPTALRACPQRLCTTTRIELAKNWRLVRPASRCELVVHSLPGPLVHKACAQPAAPRTTATPGRQHGKLGRSIRGTPPHDRQHAAVDHILDLPHRDGDDRLPGLAIDQELRRLHPWRPLAGQLRHRAVGRRLGHERLAADGPARRALPQRPVGGLDRDRPDHRRVVQLALRCRRRCASTPSAPTTR